MPAHIGCYRERLYASAASKVQHLLFQWGTQAQDRPVPYVRDVDPPSDAGGNVDARADRHAQSTHAAHGRRTRQVSNIAFSIGPFLCEIT